MSSRVRLLRFGVFEMDLEARELRRRGCRVALPPQPFLVLEELAARSGRIVSREELCARLWSDGVHVDRERGLNHCLNRIRRVLGDDARTPRFVETVPLEGYRFLANVEALVDEADALPEPRTTAPGPSISGRAWVVPVTALLLALHSGGVRGLPQPSGLDTTASSQGARAAYAEGLRLLDGGPAGWRRSVELFQEALSQDAGFGLAQQGLADAYIRLGEQGMLPADEAFPAARRAARAALALSEKAAPLVILASVELNYDWNWAAAENAYRRALRIDPELIAARLGLARLLSAGGRHAEALALIGEAERRHPGCSLTVRDAALVHYRARRFDEAARRFRDWAELEPTLPDPHHWLALLYHLRGEEGLAVGEARTVMAVAKAAPGYVARFEALPPDAAMRFYIRGSIQYLQGLTSRQWVTRDDFARLRALLGEREKTLRELEQAADERSPQILPSLGDPVFDALRSEPRFVALQQRLRVPGEASPVS